jgi:2-polyprenyl-3-methyl-5-hydroxy-6-metoxy-1,4-benzoquinol methylase
MNRSEKFWDKSSTGYDKEEMKDRKVRMKILEKTGKYLKKQDDVLDFGCATGILANEIAGDVNMVYGIDISSKMVQIARKKAAERKIRNAHYAQATIFDGKYKAGAFDMVLGIYLLHLLEDMPKALRRIHELLKPGALFISVTPCMGKRSLTGMALLFANKLGLIPDLELFDVPDLERSITNAGFKIIETECIQPTGRQQFIVARKS